MGEMGDEYMTELNKKYVDYLNSLNSYNAKNKNAYSEKNVENDFYKATSVDIGIATYIASKIRTENPQVIILSGQAGDGKTSIMYQVINKLDGDYQIKTNENKFDISVSGKSCTFIKDFSELSDNEKLEQLRNLLVLPKQEKFAFVVANTGPFINTFGQLFPEDKREKAKIELINLIKVSDGKEKEIFGYLISVINMASIDNSYFASKYLEKIVKDDLWADCSNCDKKNFCPILKNRNLIHQNIKSVQQFLENHYIWLSEHGSRLTVRSITEQLSFMITGGQTCSSVKNINNNYKYLYPNLFFGFVGFQKDSKALKMNAIKEASNNEYYLKKMRIDEQLIVRANYKDLFSTAWAEILSNIEKIVDKKTNLDKERNLFYAFLRRVYIFQNNSDEDQRIKDFQDIFSKNFCTYTKHRKSSSRIPSVVKKPILDALSMIYTGIKLNDGNKIPVTLNKKSGVLQTVQFVTGYLDTDDFDIEKIKSNDGKLNQTEDIYYFYPKIGDEILDIRLTLPLLDYFDNLQKGIIETDLDPLLSHGIESLKAQISEKSNKKRSSDEFELLLIKNNGTKTKKLEISDGQISII